MKLVADVGATNIRLAVVNQQGELIKFKQYRTNEFCSISAAYKHYCLEVNVEKVTQACFGVAAPVLGDNVTFTNNDWGFSISELKQDLKLEHLLVFNDSVTWALALNAEPFKSFPLDKNVSATYGTKAYIVPGSGVGVAALLPVANGWQPISSEAGYVNVSAISAYEHSVISYLEREYTIVSSERVLSGPGICTLFEAVSNVEGTPVANYAPQEITRLAVLKECELSEKTMRVYLALLGSFARNVCLVYGAVGGVYLSGNIINGLSSLIPESEFKNRFYGLGRASSYLRNISCDFCIGENNSLLGCRDALFNKYWDDLD